MKQKVLKIKTGDVYVNGKNIPAFLSAFQKTSKAGKTYYEMRVPVLVQEIEQKQDVKKENIEA